MKALSSNHASHDQQVADALAWIRAWAECGPERHEWGPVEHATMTGTPHRKCIYCRATTLDLDDEVEA